MFCRLVAVFSFIAATSNVVVIVDAYPTGAGACPGGMAATTGVHADPAGGVPTFADKGYEIVLNAGEETEMVVEDDVVPVLAQTMYTVSVRAPTSVFRGALIRLEGDDSTLEPGTNAKVADVCEDVAGITHTDAMDKSILSGIMMITEDSFLDVTVVESNNVAANVSVYSYSRVQLQIMAPPTTAPVQMVEPTASSPTAGPTTVPKPGPPISAPTAGPTTTAPAVMTPTNNSTTSSKAPTMMGKEPTAGKGPTDEMAPTTPGGTAPTTPNVTAPTAPVVMTGPNSTTPATAPGAAPPTAGSSAPIMTTTTTTGFMVGLVGAVFWSMLY